MRPEIIVIVFVFLLAVAAGAFLSFASALTDEKTIEDEDHEWRNEK